MLRSKLFRGNKRLEACAVNHAQHVVRNNTGDFVSKIQEALVILDDAIIMGNEVSVQTYGASTAKCVLDYKTKRNIVNRAYQTAPDEIVGIMTITKMDEEMAKLEAEMPEMIRRARVAAFQRTFAAFMQVAGIGPATPDKRENPATGNLIRARNLAIPIFNDPNPNMTDIGDTLGDMKNRIALPPVEQAHFPDPRCGNRAGFVVGNRIPIFLCPRFFGGSEESRIRTFVHEAAHLTGIGDSTGEPYYGKFNLRNEDPEIIEGTPQKTSRRDIADTWAKYVNALTNQPPDADDNINDKF